MMWGGKLCWWSMWRSSDVDHKSHGAFVVVGKEQKKARKRKKKKDSMLCDQVVEETGKPRGGETRIIQRSARHWFPHAFSLDSSFESNEHGSQDSCRAKRTETKPGVKWRNNGTSCRPPPPPPGG